jgi:glutamyl-tRNA synthetase
MPDHPTVVTRFAPSPTGHLHIGGARSALFCWAFARGFERAARARGAAPGSGGRFMIRIEDTDQARSSDESARGILEDLAWLGVEWDDGPRLDLPGGRSIGATARDVGGYFQARRLPIYNAYLRWMVENDRAYPAFEPAAELEARRKAAVAAKQTYRYDRSEHRRLPTPAARLSAMDEADRAGTPYVVRFLMPAEDITVADRVLGEVKYRHTEGGIDDFVIRKADGMPTYHFAVVIDDELMGVTHVLRAQEHLQNTPRHIALQRSLRRLDTGAPFRTPEYAHMPLICNMDGSKMSKRDKAKAARKFLKDQAGKPGGSVADVAAKAGVAAADLEAFIAADNDSLETAARVAKAYGLALPEIEIDDFRRSGYLPEAIINFIALLGWNPGMKTPDGKDLEKFDAAFLAEHFAVERIGKTSAKFDRAKLLSFNADYVQGLSDDAFLDRWRAFLREHEPDVLHALESRGGATMALLAAAVKPRARTLRDAISAARFALVGDDAFAFDPKALDKLRAPDAKNAPAGQAPRAGVDLLATARERFAALADADFTPGLLHAALEQLAQQQGVGIGQIAQPVRVALTGTGVSPGIAETLAILGRASALRRIDRCLEAARV